MIPSGIVNLSGLLERIIDEASAERRRRHELKIKELSIIENSALRDEYVKQILLDKFLAPIEKAQYEIQATAKHAQWLAGEINYYYLDHGLNLEQTRELTRQLGYLAIKITQVESLDDLKFVYAVTTAFRHEVSVFKHPEKKYSIERSIRKGILEPLNNCIATTVNFQARIELMRSMQNTEGMDSQ